MFKGARTRTRSVWIEGACDDWSLPLGEWAVFALQRRGKLTTTHEPFFGASGPVAGREWVLEPLGSGQPVEPSTPLLWLFAMLASWLGLALVFEMSARFALRRDSLRTHTPSRQQLPSTPNASM